MLHPSQRSRNKGLVKLIQVKGAIGKADAKIKINIPIPIFRVDELFFFFIYLLYFVWEHKFNWKNFVKVS